MFSILKNFSALCADVVFAPLGIVTGVWIAILVVLFAAITAGIILAVRAKKHKKEVAEYLEKSRKDKKDE